MQLLFVDDDPEILNINQTYFTGRGYNVTTASTREQALAFLKQQSFDCVILDILLTEEPEGYLLCRCIKAETDAPVIFLTSMAEQEALYRGFSSGGDDFMTKPFDLRELEMRIAAHAKKGSRQGSTGEVFSYPPLTIDVGRRMVMIHNTQVKLTVNEFDVFLLLARQPEKVFSLEEIYRAVWHMPDLDSTHTVQVHIGRLRRKLEEAYSEHSFVTTSWGKGYLFSP